MLVALATTPFVPAGVPVLLAAAVAIVVGVVAAPPDPTDAVTEPQGAAS